MIALLPAHNWVRRVQRFVAAPPAERCALCGGGIPTAHPHLLDLGERRLLCACPDCAGAAAKRGDGAYRLVRQRIEVLDDFRLAEADWNAFRIPIDMAFLLYSTLEKRPVAFYPGPAGATESLLSLDSWSRLVAENPVLASLEPDTEALLVNRTRGKREHYLVSIDHCYRLSGVIRTGWRGFSGGSEVWKAIDSYFAQLREMACRDAGRGSEDSPGHWAGEWGHG
jgi:hypothetical protein